MPERIVAGADAADLDRRAGLAGYPLVATLIASPCSETERELVRELLQGYGTGWRDLTQ